MLHSGYFFMICYVNDVICICRIELYWAKTERRDQNGAGFRYGVEYALVPPSSSEAVAVNTNGSSSKGPKDEGAQLNWRHRMNLTQPHQSFQLNAKVGHNRYLQ